MEKSVYFSLFCAILCHLLSRGDAGPLALLHGGCNSAHKSRTPDCVAAMHRFCEIRPYFVHGVNKQIGVSREVGHSSIGLSCITGKWYGHVSLSTLRLYHGHCHLHQSQMKFCLSAIHRYCSGHYGANYAGTAQEVGNGFFAVGCFHAPLVHNVRWSALTRKHGHCVFPHSESAACYSAASRWCNSRGYSGGITQEVNQSIVTVACYRSYTRYVPI